MKPHYLKSQAGYMLLLTLIALMGLGGVVLAGFSQEAKQQVDHERYLHNDRVLREAKQALLQYAYNYPDFNSEGPGRLPCPDDDNDGLTGPLTVALCTSVGRLPWFEPELNFYDARDASDARLWYAVSDAFYNLGGGPVINSDSVGTITIQDQSGSIMYDGTVSGIAAVIIAPGPAIDRAGVAQDRVADENDPANYLDLSGAADNADFVNNSVNGFVLGPVENMATGTLLVNDQIILITTEELLAVAEKATLQAYQLAMQDYSDRLENDVAAAPAPWNRYYPWLYNYVVNNIDSYPSDPVFDPTEKAFLGNIGRVPSIYSNYFTEASSQAIESELDVDFTLDYPVTPTTVGYDQVLPAVATGTFDFNSAAQHVFSAISPLPHTIIFSDIADVIGQDGRISATDITPQPPFQVELWFWDNLELLPPTGIWKVCPVLGGVASDCNRDSAGNPTPGSATNDADSHVLRVIAEIDFSGTVNFDMDYTTAPTITATSAADGFSHATIQALFLGGDVIAVPVTLNYEIDRFYSTSFDIQESGTMIVDDLTTGDLTLGLRYYPELPAWAFANSWHNSMQMAYAFKYRPDQLPANCAVGVDCLQIDNLGGINDDKISLLAIAGEHDWDDDLSDGFFNDVIDVFDFGNHDIDAVFDVRANNGNDKILVLEEL